MGGIARIKKGLDRPIAMADAKMSVNGCRVYLGHPNPLAAKKAAAQFGKFMEQTVQRARRVNIGDLYAAHFRILEKISKGEEIYGKGQQEASNVN